MPPRSSAQRLLIFRSRADRRDDFRVFFREIFVYSKYEVYRNIPRQREKFFNKENGREKDSSLAAPISLLLPRDMVAGLAGNI